MSNEEIASMARLMELCTVIIFLMIFFSIGVAM